MMIEKNGYYFTKVNPATKQGRYMLYDFARAGYKDIFEAYENPSAYKVRVYWHCVAMTDRLNGRSGRVSSKNSMCFSFMFSFTDDEGSYIVKVTKNHNFIMKCEG